jgi:hypothetical protein
VIIINEIVEYMQEWDKTECHLRLENDAVFIKLFLDCLNYNWYKVELDFQGEGSYFGKQWVFSFSDSPFDNPLIRFELCYDHKQIAVYPANHHGFRVPEYISINKNDDSFDIYVAVIDFILKEIGIK